MKHIKKLTWLISLCVLLGLLIHAYDNWETESLGKVGWEYTYDECMAMPTPNPYDCRLKANYYWGTYNATN